MNKCPRCKEYGLDYDVFQKRAICTYNGCGFKKRMNEEEYIMHFADKTKSIAKPSSLKTEAKNKNLFK